MIWNKSKKIFWLNSIFLLHLISNRSRNSDRIDLPFNLFTAIINNSLQIGQLMIGAKI